MDIQELRTLQGELADLGLPDLQVKEIQFFMIEVEAGYEPFKTTMIQKFHFESLDSVPEILKTLNQRKIRTKMQDFFCDPGKKICRGRTGFSTFNHLMNLVKIPVSPCPGNLVIFGFRTKQKIVAAKIFEHTYRSLKPSWIVVGINDSVVSQIHHIVERTPFSYD